jgi:hypothetical protein
MLTLSKETIAALIDLIENKLAIMCVADCDDLRERITMQRALSELRGVSPQDVGLSKNIGIIHHRGRRRKVSDILGESGTH